MTVDRSKFKKIEYKNGQSLFFDEKLSFHDLFKHRRKTIKFPFHKNILQFLNDNSGIEISAFLNNR